MLEACERIAEFRTAMDWDRPGRSAMAWHAIRDNLTVLGEAAKHVAAGVRERAPDVDWRKLAGLRDVLVHGYFQIDVSIVRDIAEFKVDALATALRSLLESMTVSAPPKTGGAGTGKSDGGELSERSRELLDGQGEDM
jgi:uncharacterized protein with HEPN domain